MSESVSQGIPSLVLDSTKKIRLYKCNDISFTQLKIEGFVCLDSSKKPDQIVAHGGDKKNILIGIEDKDRDNQLDEAIQQIKDNYLGALPDTKYFIARAGNRVKVFYRTNGNLLIEINTLKNGYPCLVFGPRVVTNENTTAVENLILFSAEILKGGNLANNELEITPSVEYFNPLENNSNIIKRLWQKIFVCTGEQAHSCLNTFVELLVYKGLSDAKILSSDYRLQTLKQSNVQNSLNTYKNTVRKYINDDIFPSNKKGQPGVVNLSLFAFTGQETTFKSVLNDLDELGNIAQRQLDPDFKRRVLETFLGSSNREGKIKNGQHLTPRNIVHSIWRMANPKPSAKISDVACGVGGFVLEGLNHPFNFKYNEYKCYGIDKSKEMITLAKANMVLHLLDVIAANPEDISDINDVINSTFLYTDRNGTGTLSELRKDPNNSENFIVKHDADYVFANVPFFSSGVSEINKSLNELGGMDKYYEDTGLGIQSDFIKYILGQIENNDPGMAFVIVPDGILRSLNSKTRDIIKEKSDVLAIISLPIGTFQNNNWKTSLLIFQRKTEENKFAKVMLYNVDDIGISLDQFRVPIEKNDLISMEISWQQRLAGESTDPKCRFISRNEFNSAEKWTDLFNAFGQEDDETISFSECIENLRKLKTDFSAKIEDIDTSLAELFEFEDSVHISLEDEKYFIVYTPSYQPTIRYAKTHKGKYPLYSSQVSGPVEYMYSEENKPILHENEEISQIEENARNIKKVVSWNIKGDAAKDIRLHDTPFYGTENRGIIEVVDSKIDIEYVKVFLSENLVSLGEFSRDNEAHVGKVKRIDIIIPVNDNDEMDVDKQRQIVEGYKKMNDFKLEMDAIMNRMVDLLSRLSITK